MTQWRSCELRWVLLSGKSQSGKSHQRQSNILRPRQNGHYFPDDIFKCISLNENVWISIKITLKFIPKGPINNILALVQIMTWRRPGDKPLSELILVSLLMHICVTRPQWVKLFSCTKIIVFRLKFHWSIFLWVQLTKNVSIGSDNGLAPIRRQAIIWTNGGRVYLRISYTTRHK